MPDWTYQTVFRPVLRQVRYSFAQSLVFRSMGMLGRNPLGRVVISLMGHAKPSAEVAVSNGTQMFPSPVALGCGVDQAAQAVSSVSLFGFGLIEVGPLADSSAQTPAQTSAQTPADSQSTSESNPGDVDSEWSDVGITISTDRALDLHSLMKALRANSFHNDVPVVVRLPPVTQFNLEFLVESADQLKDLVDGFSLPVQSETTEELSALGKKLHDLNAIVLGVVDPATTDSSKAMGLSQTLKFSGIILQALSSVHGFRNELDPEDTVVWIESFKADSVTAARPNHSFVIASGNVIEPGDALHLLNAGADMVMVDRGFAAAGPGLPKRINSAVLSTKQLNASPATTADKIPAAQRSWFWAFLLGLSLTVGGVLVLIIGWTRVLLPYDEEFLEMVRQEVCGINDRLLPFMSHDRVTLAGTMLSLGPLYMVLAWFGDRRGMHWARVTILSSAFIGFLSFFLFLGFGYFDPLHAFVATISFQLTALCLQSSQPRPVLVEFDLHNSPSWRRAMWGQLLMVLHGAAVLVAGMIISSFGVTTVFVPDDLAFMQTSREALVSANPRLVPLVAHDRASFGGMLMATGVTVLLSSVWGWQRGRRWLWNVLAFSGTVAYCTTIIIHWHVQYTSLQHLLPAYGGLLFLWLALLMSREWMSEDSSAVDA